MKAAQGISGLQPWQRAALTLLLALIPVAGQYVPMPGIDYDSELAQRAAPSVFVSGVTPLLSGYLLVEFAALLVPRWRKLRHGFPDGRVRLRRATEILALVLVAFQAAGLSMLLSTVSSRGLAGGVAPLGVLSAMAATALLILAVRAIDELGLVNGVVALSVTCEALRAPRFFEQAPRLEPRNIALVVLLYALPMVATWAAIRRAEQGASSQRVWLAGPLSSLRPVLLTGGLLGLPSALQPFRVEGMDSLAGWISGPHYFDLLLGLSVLITLLVSYLLQQPHRVLRVLRGVDLREPHPTRQDVWQALRQGTLPTLLLIITVLISGQLLLANDLPDYTFTLALVTALAMDGAQALNLHRALPGLTCVWEERRPYAVPGLVAAAQEAGITLCASGLAQTSLLRVFGPFAAIRLWSATEQAEEARELLGELLRKANGTPPVQQLPDAATEDETEEDEVETEEDEVETEEDETETEEDETETEEDETEEPRGKA